MFEYQKNQTFFCQIAGSLEELGAEEISQFGAKNLRPVYRGAYFSADHQTLYRINYQSRLANRILAPLVQFKCHNTDVLYKTALKLEWSQFLTPRNSFAIFANVSHSKISHSQYAALRLKDAIADYFRANTGSRPSVKKTTPDIWFNLHIENDRAIISLDTSGGSLHRRGYRLESTKTPMQETVAAAIVRLSGWNGQTPLLDPMCGSGTLLGEALMHVCHIPAGYLRKRFGFEQLPDFKPDVWQKIKQDADHKITIVSGNLISGCDQSGKAISVAERNLRRLPGGNKIDLQKTDFRELKVPENSTLICNPPHGIREGKKADVVRLYNDFGDFLKQKCQGSTAYIYFGDRELISYIRLKPSWKKPLVNGGIEGRLVKFEIY